MTYFNKYADSMQIVCRLYAQLMQPLFTLYADFMQILCRLYADAFVTMRYSQPSTIIAMLAEYKKQVASAIMVTWLIYNTCTSTFSYFLVYTW